MTASAVCNNVFMGDIREYDGPFLRELASSAKTDEELYEHLGNSARYSRFLREKIVEAVLRCMDGGGRREALASRVLAQGVRRAKAGAPYTLETLNGAIRSDEEWTDFQKDRIRKIAGMCGKELCEDQVEKLMSFEGFDAIRAAMEHQDAVHDGHLEDGRSEDGSSEDGSPEVQCRGPGPRTSEDQVDEEWLTHFEKAYGREAFVHEYVLLRRVGLPLAEVYKTHFQMYQTISDLQRSYLDKHITESEFVRKFVPKILTEGGVCDQHLNDVLGSKEYHDNMCSRLQTVHRALYGEPMSQDETSYLFSNKVLAERLTLQCERLNEIVVDFAKETDELGDSVIEVYKFWLGRLPDEWEIKASMPLFRADVAGASISLKETLVASLEFNDLIKRIIQEQAPDFTQAEVFRTLAKVLARNDKTTLSPYQIVEKELCRV